MDGHTQHASIYTKTKIHICIKETHTRTHKTNTLIITGLNIKVHANTKAQRHAEMHLQTNQIHKDTPKQTKDHAHRKIKKTKINTSNFLKKSL